MARDFLDEITTERTARDPSFPQKVQEALARQDRMRLASSKDNTLSVMVDHGKPQRREKQRLHAARTGGKTPV